MPNPNGGVLLTGRGVYFAQLAAQAQAGHLQLNGMHHSTGKSVIAHCKKQYKLRGTNEFVVEQLDAMVAGAIAGKEYQRHEKTWAEVKAIHDALPYAELQIAFSRGLEDKF